MVGLPLCVLRTFFGDDARPRPGTWNGLVAMVAIFAFSLLFCGMSGQLDGSAAAAMIMLPGFVTLLGILRLSGTSALYGATWYRSDLADI